MSKSSSQAKLSAICSALTATDDEIVRIQTALTAFRAVPPEQGGDGEEKKAAWITDYLEDLGYQTSSYVSEDPRVSSGKRPNIVVKIPGKTKETLWIFTHTDVVAAGDNSAWTHDPWTVYRDGDWLYGRGVEDNQQALVSSLLLARALKQTNILADRTLGLVFMADEESGSTHGLAYLLQKEPTLFSQDDIFLVPDFGKPDASCIEVAEKAAFWFRIECIGKQCHASTPEKGVNAFLAQSSIVVALCERLPGLFPDVNPLFSPPISTFVPSMPIGLESGINIVPGKAIFHLDCRLLPTVSPDLVEQKIAMIAEEIAKRYSVQTKISCVQAQVSSMTDANDPRVTLLSQAIKAVYGVQPKPLGLGGGTVAAHLRGHGYPALVWACITNTCHEPNERSSLTATKNDSCVFAHLLFQNHA